MIYAGFKLGSERYFERNGLITSLLLLENYALNLSNTIDRYTALYSLRYNSLFKLKGCIYYVNLISLLISALNK